MSALLELIKTEQEKQRLLHLEGNLIKNEIERKTSDWKYKWRAFYRKWMDKFMTNESYVVGLTFVTMDLLNFGYNYYMKKMHFKECLRCVVKSVTRHSIYAYASHQILQRITIYAYINRIKLTQTQLVIGNIFGSLLFNVIFDTIYDTILPKIEFKKSLKDVNLYNALTYFHFNVNDITNKDLFNKNEILKRYKIYSQESNMDITILQNYFDLLNKLTEIS